LARRDFLRQGGRWAVGGALTAWLLGSQTAAANADVGILGSPHCGDYNAYGYGCYYRYCYRYEYGNRCHARADGTCPGGGQCWNANGRRFCDWWIYPNGNQLPCHCSQVWP
jgi:hypothetical protein